MSCPIGRDDLPEAVNESAPRVAWPPGRQPRPTEQALIYPLITGDWDGSA